MRKEVTLEYGGRYIKGPSRGLYANRNSVARACSGTHIRTMDDDHEFTSDHFKIVSDGIEKDEICSPRTHLGKSLIIFFGGMLHLNYYPLFESLASALDQLADGSWKPIVCLRGTQRLPFLEGRRFELHRLSATLSNEDLLYDLEKADILYRPIGFSMPHFYRHSLSTKVVGYLAAPEVIFYHGPIDSVVAGLLQKANAAAFCATLAPNKIAEVSIQSLARSREFSANVKHLALDHFNLADMRRRFWNPAE